MASRTIVIFGGPGLGAVMVQSISALAAAGANIRLLGFLNDVLPRDTLVSGVPVLGSFSAWRELPGDVTFLAPLHKAKEMPARAHIIAGLGIPEHRWATVIDPRSAVAADAAIGRGCFIEAFATVGPNAKVGVQTTVRAGAYISHDCALGEFVFVGSGAIVCGYSIVNDGAYIAPNSTVRERCRVGKFAVVGFGSVVMKDVPDFTVTVGRPAREPRGRRGPMDGPPANHRG